jgi:hypothetical protein
MLHLHLDRLCLDQGQCFHRAKLNTYRALLTTGAQVALEVPVLDFVVEDSVVRTVGGASATQSTFVIKDDHHTAIIQDHGIAGAGQYAIGFITVPADHNVELISIHILGNYQAGQA